MIDAPRSADHATRTFRHGIRRVPVAALVAALLTVTACSKPASKVAESAGTAAASTTSAPWKQLACDRKSDGKVTATKVSGPQGSFDLTSFDGTRIRAHWFKSGSARPAPTVLMGPGWSLAGDTSQSTVKVSSIMSVVTIPALVKSGYNVLTWDPRGFGSSDGTVTVDSPSFEARDVSSLVDWVATRPEAALDAMDDPRVGMVGASYGGGIAFVTAATDCRIDVIAPTVAWNSLRTSLYKADTFKAGWANILTSLGEHHDLDPHITEAAEEGNRTGALDRGDVAWFAARGPTQLLDQIKIPTLINQGTVDNLFTLDEGVRNYLTIAKNGAPTSMLWFCGGHGVCLTDDGTAPDIEQATLSWLDRYLKLESHAPTLPGFSTVDQHGTVHRFDSYPAPAGPPLTASGHGTLSLNDDGGSGPADTTGVSDPLAALAGPVTPARATNAVETTIETGTHRRLVLGAPMLRLTYRGTSPDWVEGPQRVFAQVVDNSTGLVLGNQITPIDLTLDGKTHVATAALEIVVFDAKPGATLTLQLTPTTVLYAKPALGGSVRFSSISVRLPTAD